MTADQDTIERVNKLDRIGFLLEFQPLIETTSTKIARNAGRWSEKEELRSSGYIALLMAWEEYQADQSVDLAARAKTAVHDAMYAERLRAWPGYKDKNGRWRGERDPLPFQRESRPGVKSDWEQRGLEAGVYTRNHANEVIAKVDYERARNGITNPLTRDVWDFVQANKDPEETRIPSNVRLRAAKEFGITPLQVQRHITKARKKVRAAMGVNEFTPPGITPL